MFGLGLTFVINSLCAISDNICIPQNPAVVPEGVVGVGVGSSRQNPFMDNNPGWWGRRPPIIDTKYGLIEGHYMQTIRNRTIAGFEGVRFGRPPVGRLRFAAPVPIREPWTGIQTATGLKHACLQMDATQFYRIYGNEDCLFVNVYTPMLPDESLSRDRKKLLPVLAFIHGGGHFFGTSGLYGPAYLLDTQNVVMVTFNYRVGVLGYLSTGDSAAPGNNALKDQALALGWIQENIDRFGGDKNAITLMGQSAGSVAVGLHLLSHKTRDIPVGAIMHSGDPLSLWGIINGTYENTRSIARRARCPPNNSQGLVACLRRLNANTLVQKQFEIFKRLTFPLMTFGPIVEHPHPGAFLLESPEMAYARGNVSRVPILQGFVPNEGDFMAAISYLLQYDRVLNREFETLLPLALEFNNQKPAKIKQILRTIDREYFPRSEPFTFHSRAHISQLFGDRYFIFGVRKGLEWHSKLAPTYGFVFDYKGRHTSLESLGLRSSDWGVSHIDDLQFIFNSTLFFKSLTTVDVDFRMVEFMTNVWGNFITKRIPYYTNGAGEDVEFWSKVDPKSKIPTIVKLNDLLDKSSMIPFPYERRYQLWRSFKLKDDFDVDVAAVAVHGRQIIGDEDDDDDDASENNL